MRSSERSSFFDWLTEQVERQDTTGVFARHAVSDKIFPRYAKKLHIFLLRYEHLPEQRVWLKKAHREWRRLSYDR